MGSKSSSETSSINTTKDFTFNNLDNRVLSGEGGGVIGGNTTFNLGEGDISGNLAVTSTDHGAIQAATDFALSSLDNVRETVKLSSDNVRDTVRLSNQTTQQAIDRSLALATVAQRSESATLIEGFGKAGVIVAVATIAGIVFFKIKK